MGSTKETGEIKKSEDSEFIILEHIYESKNNDLILKQRDLAAIAGTSLGMTNTILKRLVNKGWIKIRRLNSRNIKYLITLDGVNEIARRSYKYFKRTIKNVVFYKELIEAEIWGAKDKGYGVIILVGISDLDFIVEHASTRLGLSFLKVVDLNTAKAALKDDVFIVLSENLNGKDFPIDSDYLELSQLIMGQNNE